MTIQTVLNVTQTALVIDTAGHLLGSREPYLYDDGTISAANFAILQAHLNSGRLRLLTGGVTIPSPSQGASFVSVTISGQNLVFTDSLGGTSTVAVPGGDVDLSAYVRADDLEAVPDLVLQDDLNAAVADKINAAQAGTIASTAATTAVSGVIAPIQAAVNDARKGVVDGSFGVSIGIHDAAPASLYASQNPAAEYDPITNRTYVAYLSTENRALAIRYFDHATGTFSNKQYIGEYLIGNTEDTHGAPSLAIDQNARRIIISFGVHNANLALARSGANLDITSWSITRPSFLSSYGHVAYDAVSQSTFVMFRAGNLHTTDGATVPNAHECGRVIKSTDGGATWAEVVGARVNTKIIYTSDLGTDYYGSDFDAYNGRLYMSFSIAHAVSGSADPHDGPRAGAYVCYLDPADGLLHAVDGQVIDLYTTASDFAKARIATGDYAYPVKTAVTPDGKILTSFNKYDSTVNYVRNFAAYWDGTKWTVTDTGVYANYLYNGTSVQYRVIAGVGTWEVIAIRNITGDNVVASTDQKDTLNGSSNGGDVVKLKSTDGLTFAVDASWDAERFTTPITYVQAVRYAQPGLLFLLQGVLYSTIADKATGVDASRGTGNIASYNTSDWQSEIFFMYATTNLPAILNIQRRSEVQYNVNPINRLVGTSSTPKVTPPTAWTSLNVSPDPLPRGTRSVRLRVTFAASVAAVGRVLVQFRQSTANRDSDDEVTFDGNVTWEQVATVDVPVGADGNIQWKATTDSGITATVGLTIRSFKLGSQRLLSKAPKTGITAAAPVVITIPSTTPVTPTAPTITATAGDAQVTVAQSAAGANVNSLAVYRSATSTVDTSSGATPVATSLPFTDTGRTNGTTYYYQVKATSTTGNTAVSNVASAAPVASATPPGTATITSSSNSTGVILSGSATGATSYKVYRGTATGFTPGTALATGVTLPYTDTTGTVGTTYYYVVKGTNGNGDSTAFSNEVSGTKAAAPTTYSADFLTTPTGWSQTSNNPTPSTGTWAGTSSGLAFSGSNQTTAYNYLYISPYTGTATNEFAQSDVTALATTATPLATSVFINYTDINNYIFGSFAFTSGSSTAGTWNIVSTVGGTATTVSSASMAPPALPYTQRLERNGSTVNLLLNGSVVATTTQSTLTGVGTGVRERSGGSTYTQSELQRTKNFVTGAVA